MGGPTFLAQFGSPNTSRNLWFLVSAAKTLSFLDGTWGAPASEALLTQSARFHSLSLSTSLRVKEHSGTYDHHEGYPYEITFADNYTFGGRLYCTRRLCLLIQALKPTD